MSAHYRTIAHNDIVNLGVLTVLSVAAALVAAALAWPLVLFLLLGLIGANLFFIVLLLLTHSM